MGKLLARVVAGLAVAMVVAAPVAHADYLFDVCPSGDTGVASTVTSCPFADNVRWAYFTSPRTLVEAYSPVTGQLYEMYCDSHQVVTLVGGYQRLAVRCDGGTNAAVVFW